MEKIKGFGRVPAFAIAISLMAVVYGFVSADESQDVTANITAVMPQAAAGVKAPQPVEPINTILTQTPVTSETWLTNQIVNDLFTSPPDASKTVYAHFNTGFCNAPPEQGSCPKDILLQFGDAKFSSIIGLTKMDAAAQAAANAYMTNLINPPGAQRPTGLGTDGNATTGIDATIIKDPAKLKIYAQSLGEEAMLSIIRQPFAEMMAKRTASSGPTEMQYMEQQAIQRLVNPTWKTNLAAGTPKDLQMDIAQMQAFQLFMQYQQYRQNERIEALLALIAYENYQVAKAAAAKIASVPTS